jgi:hypothetical protein
MNHIREGAFLLNVLYGYDEEAIAAYCLHPLFQGDDSLQALLSEGDTRLATLPPRVIILGMEYRRVANSYTLRTALRRPEEIDLGPLETVHRMLTADKIQNRKDFVEHMQAANDRATYRRTVERTLNYFDSWLSRLGVTQERYQELVAQLEQSGVHDDAIEDEQGGGDTWTTFGPPSQSNTRP